MPIDPLGIRVLSNAQDDVITRAVLLVLRTIAVPDSEATAGRWRLRSSKTVLSDQALMDALRGMPKPLVCEVIQTAAGMELNCGQPDDNPRWQWWAEPNQEGDVFSPRDREEMDRTGNRRILLASETDSLVLSDKEVEELARDYIIIGPHTVCSFLASRLDPALDVAIVRRYWPSSGSSVMIEDANER